MYELVQVADNTYYMDCPSKVGIVKINDDEVVLIDAGSDKDAAKKVKKILEAQGWKLRAIYNTHYHADHIGGNHYLQSQTNCKIYTPGIDCCLANNTELGPTVIYGGYSFKEMHSKLLYAESSEAELLTEAVMPEGMEIIPLPGHCFNMVGYRTMDDVVFLADCLSSEETLQKYQVGYIYDVKTYVETLRYVQKLQAKCFVPSHANVTSDIVALAEFNIEKVQEIIEAIKDILTVPKSFDDLLAEVFNRFGLNMTMQQNILVGSTTRSYLSYLKNEGLVDFYFENNRMMWKCHP